MCICLCIYIYICVCVCVCVCVFVYIRSPTNKSTKGILPVTVRQPAIYGVECEIDKEAAGTNRCQPVSGRVEEINGKAQSGWPIHAPRFSLVDLRIQSRLIFHLYFVVIAHRS